MNKYALIKSQNIIENTVLWDGISSWTPPENMICINIEGMECGIGLSYDGTVFTAPIQPEPTEPIEPTNPT